MHRTDKYSQHSSIIWPVWLNGSVFVYELSGCGFESRCCQAKPQLRKHLILICAKKYIYSKLKKIPELLNRYNEIFIELSNRN